MEYKILSVMGASDEEAVQRLESRVISYMEEGWKPQGGIAFEIRPFSYSKDEFYALQAIIKEE